MTLGKSLPYDSCFKKFITSLTMVSFSSALDSAIIKVILITHYFEYSTYLEPYNSSYFSEEKNDKIE